jgi:hypothetical protein
MNVTLTAFLVTMMGISFAKVAFSQSGPSPDNEHGGGSYFQWKCIYAYAFMYVHNTITYMLCIYYAEP